MKINELLSKIDPDRVAVQVVNDAIIGAKQRRFYVELSIGTDAVSMREIATGHFDNIIFLVSVKREDYDAAITAPDAEVSRG